MPLILYWILWVKGKYQQEMVNKGLHLPIRAETEVICALGVLDERNYSMYSPIFKSPENPIQSKLWEILFKNNPKRVCLILELTLSPCGLTHTFLPCHTPTPAPPLPSPGQLLEFHTLPSREILGAWHLCSFFSPFSKPFRRENTNH